MRWADVRTAYPDQWLVIEALDARTESGRRLWVKSATVDDLAVQYARPMSRPSLDVLDPPAWGAAPEGATGLMRRCHALRSTPIDELTVEGLRLMIQQQIGLRYLVPIALQRLRQDPLAEGDFYPGDLLAALLRVAGDFWQQRPELYRELRNVLDALTHDRTADVDPAVQETIAEFTRREHRT